MITILYIIDTWLPEPGSPSPGGAETQLALLLSSLDPERFRAIVVQLDHRMPEGRKRRGSCQLVGFPTKRFYGLQSLLRVAELRRLVRTEKVDVIHTFFEKSEVIGWIVKRLAGIPVWITSRRDLGFNRRAIYRRIFRFSSGECSMCVANCEAVKARVTAHEGLDPERVRVIYNGMDFQRLDVSSNGNVRKEIGVSDAAPLVGMVANMTFEIKGHRYFLEAARQVCARVPNTKFLLVGDGRYRANFEGMARDLGLSESVHFLGRRKDVQAILKNLDVSVLCSTSEGFSNVILESMAAGKAVVASNVGGNPEMVIDGFTGYVVRPADSQALGDAIIKLLSDRELAKRMGAAGRRRAEEWFSVDSMARGYENLYSSLVSKSSKD